MDYLLSLLTVDLVAYSKVKYLLIFIKDSRNELIINDSPARELPNQTFINHHLIVTNHKTTLLESGTLYKKNQ